MEWQAVVLAVQILLLAIGWVLFQKARGELSARAAEAPVLTEIKTLQNSIRTLLGELQQSADERAECLEQRCGDARAMLEILDSRLAEAEQLFHQINASSIPYSVMSSRTTDTYLNAADRGVALRLSSEIIRPSEGDPEEGIGLSTPNINGVRGSAQQQKRHLVFALSDAGEKPADIARAAQLSEGEVETILGLRLQRQ